MHHVQNLVHDLLEQVKNHDSHTASHQARVAHLSVVIARAMGWNDRRRLGQLYLAALSHDIGKIKIASRLLCKKNPPTPTELNLFRSHVREGKIIAHKARLPAFMQHVISDHHENWAGTGYPHKRQGSQIPIFAQILRLADTYDAIANRHAYRAPLSHEQVLRIIQEGRGQSFAPQVVDAFLKVLKTGCNALSPPSPAKPQSPFYSSGVRPLRIS